MKLHAAGWGSDAPTPAQLKELFAQIAGGRVTRFNLQDFLTSSLIPATPTIEPTERQLRARAIMGENFFGVQEAAKHFGAKWTQGQLNTLATVPFGEEVLEACKDSHALVAGYPMTLLQIRARTRRRGGSSTPIRMRGTTAKTSPERPKSEFVGISSGSSRLRARSTSRGLTSSSS